MKRTIVAILLTVAIAVAGSGALHRARVGRTEAVRVAEVG